jgi:hypothetical protein
LTSDHLAGAKLVIRTTFIALSALLPTGLLAAPFDAIKGSWRGAVQMDERERPQAHTVGPMEFHIGADGAIDGIHANGCKFSGVVQPYVGKSMFNVDLRTQSCKYEGFNRRWKGHLHFQSDWRSVALQWTSSDLPTPLTRVAGRYFDAKGTLSR